MINYEQSAIDEVYDIILYNPDVHSEMKLNIVDNLIEYYTEIEEYEKCRNLQELRLVMEKEDESNNKKT